MNGQGDTDAHGFAWSRPRALVRADGGEALLRARGAAVVSSDVAEAGVGEDRAGGGVGVGH